MVKSRIVLPLFVLAMLVGRASFADPGILLLAHGGSADWNARIEALAAQVGKTVPTEVAFGMATRSALQAGIDRLVTRGATEIVAVPLFVSSWSSVITSTEYLLGARAQAPRELAIFAKMDHSGAANTASAGHEGHNMADGTTPVKSPVPVRMTAALNAHPVVAQILASRAKSISTNPGQESVVIVAHGPSADDENARWLADMKVLAQQVGAAEPFASIDYLTLRDDAEKTIRDAATAELRGIVSRRIGEGRRVLIVPLLVSFGGIERGLRERLDTLPYTMPAQALVPDDRLVTWVLSMAGRR